MLIIIDTQNMEDPNRFGETLRNYCFVLDGYGATGCYSTFILRDEFEKVIPQTETGKKLLKLIWSDTHNTDYIKEMTSRVNMFTNGTIDIAYYWDGDGVLLIIEGNKKVITYDCKNDYEWEWL